MLDTNDIVYKANVTTWKWDWSIIWMIKLEKDKSRFYLYNWLDSSSTVSYWKYSEQQRKFIFNTNFLRYWFE